jgi:hypothetical protein
MKKPTQRRTKQNETDQTKETLLPLLVGTSKNARALHREEKTANTPLNYPRLHSFLSSPPT